MCNTASCAATATTTKNVSKEKTWGRTGRCRASCPMIPFFRDWRWGTSRLYECISEMKKGSPSGYDAETGEESAGSESSPGEPHECCSLYRIRHTQENHQFLRQDCD